MVTRGLTVEGGINRDWDRHIHTTIWEDTQITNQNLWCSPGLCSILCKDRYGKKSKEWIYVYVQLIHFTVHRKPIQHSIIHQLHANKNYQKNHKAHIENFPLPNTPFITNKCFLFPLWAILHIYCQVGNPYVNQFISCNLYFTDSVTVSRNSPTVFPTFLVS